MTINFFFGNYIGAITLFIEERPNFLREQSNKMYNPLPYYMAKVIADMPLLFVGPMIFCLLAFWSVGFHNTPENFFKIYLAVFLHV